MSQAVSLAAFIASHPEADPKEMLSVVVAETERLKESNVAQQLEYKEATEVVLDDNLNFRPRTMAQLLRLARMYAESGIVPEHYAIMNPQEYGKKIAACAIGIQMALRCKVDILTFLQCSFVHKGKIGIESKLAMAMLNTSGKIKGRVQYRLEGEGKTRKCTAFAVDAATGDTFAQSVDWKMVEDEGWHLARGTQKSKWTTLPDLMFQYRAGIFLARVHYSDVLLGMYTVEELEEIAGEHQQAAPVGSAGSLDELSTQIGATLKPAPKKRRAATSPDATGTSTPAGIMANDPAADGTTTEERLDEPAAEPVKQEPPRAKRPAAAPAATAVPTTSTATPPVAGPAGRPAPPVGGVSTVPGGTPGTARPPVSVEGLKSYMRLNFPEEWNFFDVDAIAKRAVGQQNPQGYIDLILSKKNPTWENFVLKHDESEESQEVGGELFSQEEPVEQQEASQEETPLCISDPLPAPNGRTDAGFAVQRQIVTYKQAARIRKLMEEIRKNTALDQEECSYLLDFAERRAWQIEHGIEPTDKAPGI